MADRALRYCLNASTIRGTPVLRQIEIAGLAGFGAVELWFDDIESYLAGGGSVDELRAALDRHRLEVPTLIYLGGWMDAPSDEWPRVLQRAQSRFELAARLGAPWVIAGPPAGRADPAEGARRYFELLELGTAIGSVPAMEFLGFVEQFNTIEAAVEIVERAAHPGGGVVLDPFHVFRGGGEMGAIGRLKGRQIAIAHFNDAPDAPARAEQHDADRVWPGEGHLDLQLYLELLRSAGYSGWLSLELFRPELWARDPLEVARTGLFKMRRVVEALEA
jgi:sugar phosphate isomerase/epimerase